MEGLIFGILRYFILSYLYLKLEFVFHLLLTKYLLSVHYLLLLLLHLEDVLVNHKL